MIPLETFFSIIFSSFRALPGCRQADILLFALAGHGQYPFHFRDRVVCPEDATAQCNTGNTCLHDLRNVIETDTSDGCYRQVNPVFLHHFRGAYGIEYEIANAAEQEQHQCNTYGGYYVRIAYLAF